MRGFVVDLRQPLEAICRDEGYDQVPGLAGREQH
jgi:hypothetical protein